MATHEQTHIGAVLDRLERDGYLELAEGENSYGVAVVLAQYAREEGIVIDTDIACPDCREETPAT